MNVINAREQLERTIDRMRPIEDALSKANAAREALLTSDANEKIVTFYDRQLSLGRTNGEANANRLMRELGLARNELHNAFLRLPYELQSFVNSWDGKGIDELQAQVDLARSRRDALSKVVPSDEETKSAIEREKTLYEKAQSEYTVSMANENELIQAVADKLAEIVEEMDTAVELAKLVESARAEREAEARAAKEEMLKNRQEFGITVTLRNGDGSVSPNPVPSLHGTRSHSAEDALEELHAALRECSKLVRIPEPKDSSPTVLRRHVLA